MNWKTLLRGRWLRNWLAQTVGNQARLESTQARYPDAQIALGSGVTGNVELGPGVSIRPEVFIDGYVSIGRGTFINGPAEIRSGSTQIEIGQFCSCAAGLAILAANHPITTPSTYLTTQGKYSTIFKNQACLEPITIGSDVWIGRNCTILKGVTIGHGAILGAGSVVTKDIEPYAIVGGVPAKFIRHRFPAHVREWLLQLQWWNWTDEQLEQRSWFFESDLDTLEAEDLKQLESRLR